MKSKYRIYILLVLVMYSGFIHAMEKRVEISQEDKKEWQDACIFWVFANLLVAEYDVSLGCFKFAPLSFELVGSKKFIADELGKRLDNPEFQCDCFKKLVEKRNAIFEKLGKFEEEEHSYLWCKNIKSINSLELLPFILSLEAPIKKRIEAQNRTMEIEWRKRRYRWFNPQIGFCRNIDNCLDLDIEDDFALEDLQSNDYYSY